MPTLTLMLRLIDGYVVLTYRAVPGSLYAVKEV